MLRQVLVVLSLSIVASSILRASALEDGAVIATARSVAPIGWEILSIETDQIPWGHHWGKDYTGARGVLVVLTGPRDVSFSWRDEAGRWHREPLAKESLQLWIMPDTYRDSRWSFLVHHRPVQPDLVFAGSGARVYGRPSHYIVHKTRFEALLKTAHGTGWPGSPHETWVLSWQDWKTDLKRALSAATQSQRDALPNKRMQLTSHRVLRRAW